MTSAKCLWLLRDFVPEYHHAKLGCNWTTNKGETEGGTMSLSGHYHHFDLTPGTLINNTLSCLIGITYFQ